MRAEQSQNYPKKLHHQNVSPKLDFTIPTNQLLPSHIMPKKTQILRNKLKIPTGYNLGGNTKMPAI